MKSLDDFLTTLIDTLIPNDWTPNGVTFVRMLLIPLVWALYYLVSQWAATGMFVLLAATDFVDGRLARARDAVTDFGKKLDITCDLALVWSTVFLLWREDVIVLSEQSVLFWLLVFIFAREAFVTGIRYLFKVKADEVKVNKVGKCKTASFMLGLVALLTSAVWPYGTTVGTWLIAAAAVCSFISAIHYVKQFSKPKEG